MTIVTIYGRTGCHLCEDALKVLQSLKDELNFEIKEILIDGNQELQSLYGEQIPVTHIDGVHHDYWRVDLERFTKAIEAYRSNLIQKLNVRNTAGLVKVAIEKGLI